MNTISLKILLLIYLQIKHVDLKLHLKLKILFFLISKLQCLIFSPFFHVVLCLLNPIIHIFIYENVQSSDFYPKKFVVLD